MDTENIEVLELFDDYEVKLSKTLSNLIHEYSQMKAGRANPHLLDKIVVDYYGTPTAINQMANISVPEARLMVISVWDKSALKDVEKAIIAANIGVNPNNDGSVIRLNFPELNEERRKDLVKNIRVMAENAKVVLRNARRDINDALKKMKKDSDISEDECVTFEKDVDKQLAETTLSVDNITKDKEKEVMSV